MPPPKVFLSYSHDSEEHARRVLELADRLREDGVESVLDQYEDAPSEGWPRWMERISQVRTGRARRLTPVTSASCP